MHNEHVFGVSRRSLYLFFGLIRWHLWLGRARHPGPNPFGFAVEVFNVGGWLTKNSG